MTVRRIYGMEPLEQSKKDHVEYLNTKRDVQAAPDFFYTTPEKTTCRSLDPRLIDTTRNIHMELDRPPYQPKNVQPLKNMYTDCDAQKVKTGYYPGGYTSIYGGDIQYYFDPYLAQAHNEPVYVLQTAMVPFVFQDPMGALLPQYDRVPLFQNNTNVCEYSFDQDQMSFREDLIALQSRRIDKNDYDLFNDHFTCNPKK